MPVDVERTIRFNVTIESHPAEFVNVSKYVPAAVLLMPLNK